MLAQMLSQGRMYGIDGLQRSIYSLVYPILWALIVRGKLTFFPSQPLTLLYSATRKSISFSMVAMSVKRWNSLASTNCSCQVHKTVLYSCRA